MEYEYIATVYYFPGMAQVAPGLPNASHLLLRQGPFARLEQQFCWSMSYKLFYLVVPVRNTESEFHHIEDGGTSKVS
jgi:hypothetical protein